jgi:hypothetical protein
LEEIHEEDEEEEKRDKVQAKAIDQLTGDIRRILVDLEALKRGK